MILFLVVACCIATYVDLKEMRIPNKLTALLFLVGMGNCWAHQKMAYCLVAILVFASLFNANIGAGDKKLSSVIPLYLWGDTLEFLFFFSILYLCYWLTRTINKPRPLAPAILIALVLALVKGCCEGYIQ